MLCMYACNGCMHVCLNVYMYECNVCMYVMYCNEM